MNCPKCNIEMISRDLHGAAFSECTQCQGIWINQNELRKAKDLADPNLNWMDFEIWKHEEEFKADLGSLHCPTDQLPLVSLVYGTTGTVIDYCPECHGIWLDKGELEKIIQSLEQELISKSASDYLKASLAEAKELIAGPESFASEWRDLTTVLKLFEYRALVEKPGLSKLLYFLQRTGLGLAGSNTGE